jgi:nickel/cobalt transporter (NicO) family protein
LFRFLVASFLAVVAVLVGAGAALAHPHIFIDAKAVLVFDDSGRLTAIRNSWTFDEAFSVWQIQGLDLDGDGITTSAEMQELADENLVGLAEYGFYTSAGEADEQLAFTSGQDGLFVYADNRSTLSFSAVLAQPHAIQRALEISIADPEYYVAITLRDIDDVTLENAPAGCIARLEPPREISPDLQARLFELPPDVTELPPDLAKAVRGTQGAIIVDCAGATPPPAAATAVEAVNQMATAKPVPFGGPPPEPGFILPRTGFLGWIATQQASFYQSLTAALSQLKTDWNAFWVLGGLSFLYGVFHAAGPGHGKLVISSYLLANERQVRRGIGLSFAAAFMQSAVAIVFVGVAAAILGLSSVAMGAMVGWVEIAAYSLVMLLGLWLIARKLFGWGHSHAHDDTHEHGGGDAHGRLPGDPHFGHDHGPEGHAHDHGHHHHDDHHDHTEHAHLHVVPAEATRGDWREQLGVVLAVGLRPCSGALVVLVFALSQGILIAGIVAVLLMGLGTAITVSVLAAIAVYAKDVARRLAGGSGVFANALVWWAELAGAVIVFAFGAVMVLASLS